MYTFWYPNIFLKRKKNDTNIWLRLSGEKLIEKKREKSADYRLTEYTGLSNDI